jgi:hypothetical protein
MQTSGSWFDRLTTNGFSAVRPEREGQGSYETALSRFSPWMACVMSASSG